MHDYRPTSPNASLNSFNTRHSRFSENTAYELPTTDRNVLFAQSSDYELQSPDKEALLLAPVRPEPSGNNSDSDSERLLAQARDFADSEANLYTAHNGSAFKDVTKPPKIKRSRGFYITRLALRVLSTLFSVAIVAALADVLVRFKNTIDVKQHYQNGSGTFKVWPNGLKIWPTLWLLGTAVAGSVLGIVVLLASFNKKVSALLLCRVR
ncbi:hypothetical protein P280DRAFT_474350 [Massarina eburnea CBS 473.64]|uniref:Uncharacterized protein n=1 Tax=Massarina eburnea CBS 473.64 TaxID=1395130 RepID=A0A6A6RL57_9PLEO|nr:hypothetical protein P280DRAFT_474350 [Massarina eburnea CBS 473.64]